MAWNVALLVIVVLFMVLAFGAEYAGSFVVASNLAEMVAPRLGVSEESLRRELTKAFCEYEDPRAVMRAVPFAFLALLLTIRIIQEARSRRKP